MKRTRVLAAGATGALLVVAATSFASPWWTLQRLQSAVAHRDADAVSAQVDFPALRESVKSQVIASMKGNSSLGTSFAMMLVNPIVDMVASPRGVAIMLEQGRIKFPKLAPHASDASVAPERPHYAVNYRSWDRFAVKTQDGDFIFRRAGLWSWKLAGIETADQP
jgi:hypothetical protein